MLTDFAYPWNSVKIRLIRPIRVIRVIRIHKEIVKQTQNNSNIFFSIHKLIKQNNHYNENNQTFFNGNFSHRHC